MEHRRSGDSAPGTGRGDLRVAGPPHPHAAPEPVADTVPDPFPADAPAPAAEPAPADTAAGDTAPADTAPGREGLPRGGHGGDRGGGHAGAPEKLFDRAETERFRERWHEVQSSFVDDPGEAVRRADDLASEAVEALGRAIAGHRRALAEAAGDGGTPDTERLRLALRGYRDLVDRIVAS